MSSRAHARRRLAAWDRYVRRYRRNTSLWRGSAELRLGGADYQWWVRVNRHHGRIGRVGGRWPE
jgi:hypothetical protein